MKDKRNIIIFVLIIVIACLIGILISNNISKQNINSLLSCDFKINILSRKHLQSYHHLLY